VWDDREKGHPFFVFYFWRKTMDRAQKAQMIAKAQIIADTKKRLESAELVVLAHNTGVTAEQDRMFRKTLRDEGASSKVIKNTLVRRALEGTKFAGLADQLKGPVVIVTSQDPIAAARITYNFAKANEKLVIIGGANTTEVMDLNKIKFLATLPSLDALRGKLVGILQAPGAQLARLANAYAAKDGEPASAPAADAAPAA
jgi:large subunit ribosomal protein L10